MLYCRGAQPVNRDWPVAGGLALNRSDRGKRQQCFYTIVSMAAFIRPLESLDLSDQWAEHQPQRSFLTKTPIIPCHPPKMAEVTQRKRSQKRKNCLSFSVHIWLSHDQPPCPNKSLCLGQSSVKGLHHAAYQTQCQSAGYDPPNVVVQHTSLRGHICKQTKMRLY